MTDRQRQAVGERDSPSPRRIDRCAVETIGGGGSDPAKQMKKGLRFAVRTRGLSPLGVHSARYGKRREAGGDAGSSSKKCLTAGPNGAARSGRGGRWAFTTAAPSPPLPLLVGHYVRERGRKPRREVVMATSPRLYPPGARAADTAVPEVKRAPSTMRGAGQGGRDYTRARSGVRGRINLRRVRRRPARAERRGWR